MSTTFQIIDALNKLRAEFINDPKARELLDRLLRVHVSNRNVFSSIPPITLEFMSIIRSFVRDLGRPSSSAEFSAQINEMITRIIREVTGADCVFIRKLNTDGSGELLGEVRWYDGQKIGHPPRIKLGDEGISSVILNQPYPTPVVVWNIHALDVPENIRAAHQLILDRYFVAKSASLGDEAAEVHKFLSFIHAMSCIPITIKGKTIGGIIAANGQPYLPERARELEGTLIYWQDILSFLYFVAHHFDSLENDKACLADIAHSLPWIAAADTDSDFLRRTATLLTCHYGLAWHRASIFVFRDYYPADALCVMALGGDGSPEWSVKQEGIRANNRSLLEYMRRSGGGSFAEDDLMYKMSQDMEDPIVIVANDIASQESLDKCFSGEIDTMTGYRRSGCVILGGGDEWIQRVRKNGCRVLESSLECDHYIFPLIRHSIHEPIGFVILDVPYAHSVEQTPDVALTQLVCNALSGYMADRGIGVDGWCDTFVSCCELAPVASGAISEYEMDSESVRIMISKKTS